MKKTIITNDLAAICKDARIKSGLTLTQVKNDLHSLGLCYGMSSITRFENGQQSIPAEVLLYYMKIGAKIDCLLF